MWKCPNCGREFKNTNQGHYCGKAPETVDEYIEQQIPEAKEHIVKLRNIIKKCVPGVSEYISWSMPYYEKNGQKISFAACKTYISFYLGAEILEKFVPCNCKEKMLKLICIFMTAQKWEEMLYER
ncbi:MAG: DUF1801 domain-containing protein [Oscillospiraceae bacterium]|nr:DUF1801 domain-containing protein [Oscillospiraceae bacterium]